MSFELIVNPAYLGKQPRPLTAACHDGTPFITVRCSCSQDMHIHEGQLAAIPTRRFGTTCVRCIQVMILDRVDLERGFTRLRQEGWIR